MAEDLQYSSRSDNKRKFDGQSTPPSPAASASGRRPTGFSAPISSPPLEATAPPSYKSVPPPPDGIQLAKQRAQEIAARIFSDAEAKRPRGENGSGADDLSNKSFSLDQSHKVFGQPLASQVGMNIPSSFASYGYPGSNKKIDIPNGRVGVIIGKSGETIKYLQVQSGARIQVTRDMDADPNSQNRSVEIIGTPDQISKAEQLINDVLSEADAGGSGIVAARKFTNMPTSAEHFSMKVPNNKVGLIIGKGGETIKNMQAASGARIQVIPLHLPPGDASTERTVHIDGTEEQIESAKQLVNDVISESRTRNSQVAGGYRPPRPPSGWVQPGAPLMQQTGYGYVQPGAYSGQPPQYNASQPPYGGYPPPASSGWDQSSNPATQQTTQGTGYDYYNQQQPIGGSSAPTDSNTYNYNQMPPAYNAQGSYGDSTYSQPAVGYQQAYGQAGNYAQPGAQAGYAQLIANSQTGYAQQNYGSGSAYGNIVGSAPEGSAPNYGAPVATQQAAQGYAAQPSSTAAQPGYGLPPSQPGYGNQPSEQPGYSTGHSGYAESPQGQKLPSTQTVYCQGLQTVASQAHYAQPAQGYGQPASSGYDQSSYASAVPQAGYGQSYGGGSQSQTSDYTQQPQQSYNDAYTGFMTKCQNLAGSFQWAAVQMVVVITIIPTLLYVAVIELSLLISMSLAALQLQRLYCMVFSSCRRRSTAGRIFFTGGLNEDSYSFFGIPEFCLLSILFLE